MWNYVWLRIHLRNKDSTEFRGVEQHVAAYFEANNPRCFPLKRARSIQGKVKARATLPTLLATVEKHAQTTRAILATVDRVQGEQAMLASAVRQMRSTAVRGAVTTSDRSDTS